VLAFVCQWSVRSEAEWDRIQSLEGDDLRVVNLPCSGRVDPAMILLALTRGVDAVLVVGCRDGECHYKRGTYLGRAKVALLSEMMAQMGIADWRVHFAELGALDRYALQGLIADLVGRVTAPAATR
jgi:coenzyme F420-reducing hydrogenase delta subunit